MALVTNYAVNMLRERNPKAGYKVHTGFRGKRISAVFTEKGFVE